MPPFFFYPTTLAVVYLFLFNVDWKSSNWFPRFQSLLSIMFLHFCQKYITLTSNNFFIIFLNVHFVSGTVVNMVAASFVFYLLFILIFSFFTPWTLCFSYAKQLVVSQTYLLASLHLYMVFFPSRMTPCLFGSHFSYIVWAHFRHQSGILSSCSQASLYAPETFWYGFL